MKPANTLLLLSLAAILAGCAGPRGLVPQQSTRTEALARAGLPTDVRFDRNGEELWEYATGPSGFETYLVRVGTDGRIREVTQLLTQERLLSIVPGRMTKQDVRHLLGRPGEISFPRSGEAWSWRFHLNGIQPGHLVVRFNPDNTVAERMAIVDPGGGESREDK